MRFERVVFGYRDGPAFLRGIDIAVPAGRVAVLVGRNGTGKSTILRLAAGLERAVEGRVTIAGLDPAAARSADVARRIGVVFQASDRSFMRSRLLDDVALGCRLAGVARSDAEAKAFRALDRVGLAGCADRHPLDLDAGARRLAAVAAAIVHAPAVLLMDEVQRGLDAARLQSLEAVIGAERSRGCAIVIACHDMDFVGRNADMVVHLADGAALTSETSAFFARPEAETGVPAPELHVLAAACGQAPRRGARAFVDDVVRRAGLPADPGRSGEGRP